MLNSSISKEKALSVCGTKGFQNHSDNAGNSTDDPRPGKALETLKAQFAIMGHQVYEGSDDDFIVTRWGMSRYCKDLAELQAFAVLMGVKNG